MVLVFAAVVDGEVYIIQIGYSRFHDLTLFCDMWNPAHTEEIVQGSILLIISHIYLW